MVSKSAVITGTTVLALVLLAAFGSRLLDGPDALQRDVTPGATPLPGAALQAPDVESITAPVAPRAAPAGERESITAASAPSPPDLPQTARVTVEAKWDDDGTPAASVGASAFPSSLPDAHNETQRALTDAAGRVTFEVPAPVRVGLYLQLGDSEFIDLEPGEERTVTLTATRWGRVRGRIVDAEGAPAANAEVWLSDASNYTNGLIVATVGPDGLFDIPTRASNYIGARKAGHVPSHLRDPRPGKGEVVEIVLPLRGAAARLFGQVTDRDAQPVANAKVHVGTLRGHIVELEDGTQGNQAPGVVVSTDDAGFYSVNDVEPGHVQTFARAPGFAITHLDVVVPGAGDTRHDLVLLREVRVYGIARDTAGAPIEGVSIAFGGYGEFDASRCKSGPDGSYALSSAGNGVVVRASKTGLGKAQLTVLGEPGAAVEWNPELDPGLVVRGHVRDETGAPLAGLNIQAEPGGPYALGPGRLSARTGPDGEFLLTNAKGETAYTLTIFDGSYMRLHTVEGVRGGPDPIELVVPSSARPSAHFTGQLVLPDGVRGDLLLQRRGENSASYVQFDAETGRFESGPHSPFVYELCLLVGGNQRATLLEFELAADERRDLGQVIVPGRAKLEVVIVWPAETHVDRTTVTVHERGGAQVAWENVGDAATIEIPLLAGTYAVRAGDEEASARRIVTVAAGATERVELAPERGRRVVLEPNVEGAKLPESIEWRVVDAEGWFVKSLHQSNRMERASVDVYLPIGTYEIRARASDGRTGVQRVDVGAADEAIQLAVPLRE